MTGLALRWAHLAIAIAVYLVTMGAIYGSMHAQLEEATREIREQQEQNVRRDQALHEFREDMNRRLDNLESNVLEKKSLRELK